MILLQPVTLVANCILHHVKTCLFDYGILYVDFKLCLLKQNNIYKKI
jgi:hypothetical protein